MYSFKLFNSMQRSLGTYSMRMVAKSGKSENGQIAVNSVISKLILISLPGNSYANVSSGNKFISTRGVDWIFISVLWVVILRLSLAGVEEFDQHQSREETSDVRSVRNATCLRSAAQHAKPADQLKREPHPDRDIRRHVREEPKQN